MEEKNYFFNNLFEENENNSTIRLDKKYEIQDFDEAQATEIIGPNERGVMTDAKVPQERIKPSPLWILVSMRNSWRTRDLLN